jgi:L-ribulose-5-phosphate 3-epimerase
MFDLDRREFLGTTAQTLAGLGVLGLGASTAAQAARSEPPFKLSLAQWSLHRSLRGRQKPAIDNLDFAKTAHGLGIDAIEYVNQFFKDKARDAKYLAELKKRADGEGVASRLIMCDGEGRIGDPDDAARKRAVQNHERWLEAAEFLGCFAIRVNAASSGSYDEQLARAADGLRRLCELADPHGLYVIVENHGGLSSNGAWLAAVMEKVDHPRVGTLPDFGNFALGRGKEYDRYKGVRELMPYAKAVSAKSYDFDEDGEETKIDYLRMMKIVLDAGYHNWVGIEYEGSKLDEHAGVLATKKLLERVRAQLS